MLGVRVTIAAPLSQTTLASAASSDHHSAHCGARESTENLAGRQAMGGGDGGDHAHEDLVNLDPKNLWCIKGKRYDLRQHGFPDKHPGTRCCPPG